MAKKQKAQPDAPVQQREQPVVATPDPKPEYSYSNMRFWLTTFKGQAIIVALLAFIFYCNSFNNEFAHDDGIVIVKNEYVLEGFAGIPSILTKDAYDSYYRQLNTSNQLSGGRYRPLSIITFAIEQQFLGAVTPDKVDSVLKQAVSYGVSGPGQKKLISNMHIRHAFNVFWYMLSVIALLYFLRYIVFSKYPVIALIAAVLFTIHPIHTEVVANVKSRDEIMSLLFMCLTFIFAFKYDENRKNNWLLAGGLVSFLLAFLSKEYAITILALLPLAFYIFRKQSIPKSLESILPYLIVTTVYLSIRVNVMAPAYDGEGDPTTTMIINFFPKFAFAAAAFAFYSYIKNSTPGKSDQSHFIKNVLVFLPYFFFIGLYLQQRYAAIPPVVESAGKEVLNNPYVYAEGTQKLATEIASTLSYLRMLIYPNPLSADYSYAQIPYKDFSHPLVWFSIAVHLGLLALMVAFFPRRQSVPEIPSASPKTSYAVNGRALICFALAFYFIHLILVCNIIFDIGATLGERLIFHSSVGFVIALAWLLYKGAEKLQPAGMGQKALAGLMTVLIVLCGYQTMSRNLNWKNDASLFTHDLQVVPNSVLVNANVAASYITLADYAKDEEGRKKYLRDAVKILDHTLDIHKTFVAAYLNRGIAYYKLGEIDKCVENINMVKKLYPTYPTLPGMYKLICDYYLKEGWDKFGKDGKYPQAVEIYKKGLAVDSSNVDLWYNMGGAYYTNKQFPEAINSFQMALKYQPNNPQAQNGLNAAISLMKNGGVIPQNAQGNPGK